MSKYPIPNYSNREERNLYVIELIKSSFINTKTILNIGGGQKRYLKNSGFITTEIDKEGDNDYNLNLDLIERLPFEDKNFDVVLALDVLEHLENLHFILNEILRVSKKYVIISLPNSLLDIIPIILNKRCKDEINNGVYNKFYGLPLKSPIDRHRWFLTINDIERFFKYNSLKNNYFYDILLPKGQSVKSKILGFFLSKRLKKELLTKYCWVIIKKKRE
tara:strand:- start:67 stop:723 length:657 start_codon:yes stop_codon:yes gene_type:complete